MPRRSTTGRRLSDIFFSILLFYLLYFFFFSLTFSSISIGIRQTVDPFIPEIPMESCTSSTRDSSLQSFFFFSTNRTPLNIFVMSLHVYLTVNAYKVAKCGCLRTRKYFVYLVYLLFDDVVLLLIERCACHRMPRRN